MTVTCNVEILEARLEVHASLLDGFSVLTDNVVHVDSVLVGGQVLAAGKEGVVVVHSGDSGQRVLVNAGDGEGLVDAGGESHVVEEYLGIVSFVGVGQGFELILGELEVHGRKDSLELVSSHAALAEFIKISEELLNADAFHDYERTNSVLNVSRIASDINLGLHETVVKHVNVISRILEEGVLLGAVFTVVVVGDGPVGLGVESLCTTNLLGVVSGENVSSAVNVLTEEIVVDLLSVAEVAVFTR